MFWRPAAKESIDIMVKGLKFTNTNKVLDLCSGGGGPIPSIISDIEGVSDLVLGEHNWSVDCWDEVNNLNSSGAGYFNLSVPDFVVNSLGVNSSSIKEGDLVEFSSNISNEGGASRNNVLVSFNLGGASIENTTVNLSAFSFEIVNFSWVGEVGPKEFSVSVDPENASV